MSGDEVLLTAEASTPPDRDLLTSALSHFRIHLLIDYFRTYTDPDFPRSARDTFGACGTTALHVPPISGLLHSSVGPDSEIHVATTHLLKALYDSYDSEAPHLSCALGLHATVPTARNHH